MVSWNAGTSKSSIFLRRCSIIFHCKPSSDKGVPRPQRLGWVKSWWFSVKGCSFLRQVLPWASPRSCFQPAMQRWCDAMCQLQYLQTSLAAGSHMWSLCCCLNDWDKTRWGVFITGRSGRFSGNIFVWATSSKRTCPINSSNSAKIPPHRSVSWIRIRTAGQLLFEASITGHFRNLNWRYLPILEIWAYMVLTYLHFRILKFPLIQGFATFRSLGRKPSQAMFPHKKKVFTLNFSLLMGFYPNVYLWFYDYLCISLFKWQLSLWKCFTMMALEHSWRPGWNCATVGMKHCKYWDYNGIHHLPTGAGFLPSTKCQADTGSSRVASEMDMTWCHLGKQQSNDQEFLTPATLNTTAFFSETPEIQWFPGCGKFRRLSMCAIAITARHGGTYETIQMFKLRFETRKLYGHATVTSSQPLKLCDTSEAGQVDTYLLVYKMILWLEMFEDISWYSASQIIIV